MVSGISKKKIVDLIFHKIYNDIHWDYFKHEYSGHAEYYKSTINYTVVIPVVVVNTMSFMVTKLLGICTDNLHMTKLLGISTYDQVASDIHI